MCVYVCVYVCMLSSLPDSVRTLEKLQYLGLDHNRFEEVTMCVYVRACTHTCTHTCVVCTTQIPECILRLAALETLIMYTLYGRVYICIYIRTMCMGYEH